MKLDSLLVGSAALVVVAGGAGVGCGSSLVDDCVELCERASPCSEPGLNVGTCDEQCSRFDELADAADCGDEFGDFVSCALDAPDACQLEVSCRSETMGYYLCAKPYCEANETASECRGFECSYGGSGVSPSCSVTAQCTGGPAFELDCLDGTCTCRQDGVDVATVAFDESFCGDLDSTVAAAQAACGWSM